MRNRLPSTIEVLAGHRDSDNDRVRPRERARRQEFADDRPGAASFPAAEPRPPLTNTS